MLANVIGLKRDGRGGTIDVAEATRLALLCMMQPTSPVDGDIALLPVQPRSPLHAASSTDPTELEQPIEHRTVVTDVVLALLLGETVHVVGGDALQEVD